MYRLCGNKLCASSELLIATSKALLIIFSLADVDKASEVTPCIFSDTVKVTNVYELGVGEEVGGGAVGSRVGAPLRVRVMELYLTFLSLLDQPTLIITSPSLGIVKVLPLLIVLLLSQPTLVLENVPPDVSNMY